MDAREAGDGEASPPRAGALVPPPEHLGFVTLWMLRRPPWVGCLSAAVVFAALGAWSGHGGGVGHLALRASVGAVIGVAYGLCFAWMRRRGQRPRPPEGVSAWRLGQLLREDALPMDPAERAAVARVLTRHRALGGRMLTAALVAVWVAICMGCIGYFAIQRDWWWCGAALVSLAVASLMMAVEARRQGVTHRRLREQLSS